MADSKQVEKALIILCTRNSFKEVPFSSGCTVVVRRYSNFRQREFPEKTPEPEIINLRPPGNNRSLRTDTETFQLEQRYPPFRCRPSFQAIERIIPLPPAVLSGFPVTNCFCTALKTWLFGHNKNQFRWVETFDFLRPLNVRHLRHDNDRN